MAIKYSFVDGELYGTEDINDIARNLVGAGVMPFLAKDSYNVSDLNSLTKDIVESGTSLEGCKCTMQNAGAEDMYISVGQGIVFFESGVRLTVDAAGYIVAAVPNTHGYIFAHYSPSLQKADIVFAADLPTDGEYVVLGRLEKDGKLKDERTFARSKIATAGNNATITVSEDRVTVYNAYNIAPKYSATEKIVAEIDLSGIDITKFNYLIYRYDYTGSGSTAPTYQEKYFDFKNNTRASFYIEGSLYYHNALCDIIFEESKFVIVCVDTTQHGVYDCYLRAFKSAIPYFKLV